MATKPSGSQEGSSTISNVEKSITGQSSSVVGASPVLEDRVITLNGIAGVISITSTTMTAKVNGNNIALELPSAIPASVVNISSTQTTITGTTAGSIIASMPFQGSSYKKAIFYLDGYENDSTTAQTYTFPIAFSNTPIVSVNSASVPGVTVTTTAISIAPDTTTAYTGYIIVEGY